MSIFNNLLLLSEYLDYIIPDTPYNVPAWTRQSSQPLSHLYISPALPPAMRILHLIATLDAGSGGPAIACMKMAEAVIARGHQADIFTTDWGMEKGQIPGPSSVKHTNVFTFPVTFPQFWKRSQEMEVALINRVAEYDLLHIHSLYLFHNMIGPAAARRAGKPYIVRPHGLLDPFIWRRHRLRKSIMEVAFQNRALREASVIHYTSADEMRISQPYAHAAPGVVVPLGVDLPPLAPASNVRSHGRVLFLSRLHAKKGLDLLIPAFALVKKRHPHVELEIAGPDDGALRPTQELVGKLGLEASVSFPGMLSGAAKAQAFARAGLFVLPSYSENFGIALAEAMAAGLPVVTTDQVNIHDAISSAEAGLVTPCSIQPIADAMLKIIEDRALADRLGSNGRNLVATRYSWPAIGQQLETLYSELIAGNRGTSG